MSRQELLQELENVKHDSLFAECIRLDPKGAMPMIIDQIKDNEPLCRVIIGSKLVDVIKSLK